MAIRVRIKRGWLPLDAAITPKGHWNPRTKLTVEEAGKREYERTRNYYLKNKDACNARCRANYRKTKKPRLAYRKQWEKDNPELAKAQDQRDYERHKEKRDEKVREWVFRSTSYRRGIIRDYLSCHPCVDCGESNPLCLDFDHVRGTKEMNVSKALRKTGTWSIDRLLNEIRKCEVRCANCHRIVTYQRRITNPQQPQS